MAVGRGLNWMAFSAISKRRSLGKDGYCVPSGGCRRAPALSRISMLQLPQCGPVLQQVTRHDRIDNWEPYIFGSLLGGLALLIGLCSTMDFPSAATFWGRRSYHGPTDQLAAIHEMAAGSAGA